MPRYTHHKLSPAAAAPAGNLTSISAVSAGVPIRLWTTPDAIQNMPFALGAAQKVLPRYEQAFGSKYPLPALQILAVPDFAPQAMENWG